MAVPTRGTSEQDLDRWNDAMRASSLYQNFIKKYGLAGKVGGWTREQQAALERELEANGIQIPDGMHIDQGGNLNQTNRLGKAAAIGGAAAISAFGVPGLFPGFLTAGGPAAAASQAGGTVVPAAEGGAGIVGNIAPWTAAGGSALPAGVGAAGAGAGAAAAGGSILSKLKDIVPDSVDDVAKWAALAPAFTNALGVGGNDNAFGNSDIENEVKQMLSLQRSRVEQAQPVYDSLVNMAYGMTPTRYRGNAPAGYTANQEPQGAYRYEGPRFGGNR
jgi:hypothetical protein